MIDPSGSSPTRDWRSRSLLTAAAVFAMTFGVCIVPVRNWTDVKAVLVCAVIAGARGPRSRLIAAVIGATTGHVVLGASVDVGNWSGLAWFSVACVSAVEICALATFLRAVIADSPSGHPVRRFSLFLLGSSIVAIAGGGAESLVLGSTGTSSTASTIDIMFGTAIAACLAAIALTRRGSEWFSTERTPGSELLAPLMVVLVTLVALQVTRQVWSQRDADRLEVRAQSVLATLDARWDRETQVLDSWARSLAPALAFDVSAFAQLVDPYLEENDVAVAAALLDSSSSDGRAVMESIGDTMPAMSDAGTWTVGETIIGVQGDGVLPVVIDTVDLVALDQGGKLTLAVAFSLPELVSSATSDVDGRFDDVAVLLGRSSGEGIDELMAQGDVDPASAKVRAGSISLGGQDVVVEVAAMHDFGTPGLAFVLAVELALGALLGGVLLLGANSEFKMAQERRRRENLLEAALDATPGTSVVFDAEMRVLAANRPVRQQFPRAIPGIDVLRVLGVANDSGRRRLVEDLLRSALNGQPGQIEIADDPREETDRDVPQVDRMRIFELSAYPVVSPGGEPIGFLHSVDATERRSLAMRSAQSERMESLGALAGGLAHDFNNLLFVTLGNLQLMAMNEAVIRDEKLAKFVSRSMSAVERGAEITKSLLAVARSQPLEESAVSLADLVKGILPLVRQALGAGRRVEVDIADPSLQLMVDSGRLSSCILNLAFNARDAMGPNGTLKISARLDDSDDMIELAVTDDGAGMPPDVVARAFEPFFTTKSAGSGTGLGLATVYAFAKQSGGTAFLESHIGKGTTVTMVLPRFSGEIVQENVVRKRRSGRRVVVADDEQALAEMVAAWLIDMGIDARFAISPKAALALIEEFEPDVLVSDANFGEELDGIELARLGTAIVPDMAVVFMTGYSTSMRELQELGERTLAKPFSAEDLLAALSPLIAQDDPEEAGGTSNSAGVTRKTRRAT